MNGSTAPLLGGIEAGGTKFVLAVATAPGTILATHTIPTLSPDETLPAAAEWFEAQGTLAAIGIASFGPAIVAPGAPRWGHIVRTPKPGWSDCDLAGFFARRFAVPVGFDTDVNGAALAESTMGAGRGLGTLAYVTIGTGIGGGLVIEGQTVHGAAHPEMGHCYPRRHPDDLAYSGHCPAHGDCFEGLAAGPAILARWGEPLSQLPDNHPAHEVIADYLAQLCHTIFAMTAVEAIVLGGGVMKTPGLLERIRAGAERLDNGYLPGGDRHHILPPGLGELSGITGALLLGEATLG